MNFVLSIESARKCCKIEIVPKKCIHTLDAHNSHIKRDRIMVFCSDELE
jgi:hypothetical protein